MRPWGQPIFFFQISYVGNLSRQLHAYFRRGHFDIFFFPLYHIHKALLTLELWFYENLGKSGVNSYYHRELGISWKKFRNREVKWFLRTTTQQTNVCPQAVIITSTSCHK